MHALLDRNPSVIESITKSLDISAKELADIRAANARLTLELKGEVGISTSIQAGSRSLKKPKLARILLVTATGSGSGKTFIVTGIAGAWRKQGFKVGLVKVGGDIRDLVPALYLVKEPIRDYSSIRIGESGWTPFRQALEEASRDHDLVLIEGAMNAFTGLFNETAVRPTSTAEVALALNVPTVLVVASDKEGLEGAVVNALSYAGLLRNLGIRVTGVIFNKARESYLTADMRAFVKRVFANIGVEMLGMVPRIELEGRGMIPEVEIRYEEFGAKAIETIEKSVDVNRLASQAEPLGRASGDYERLLEKFKQVVSKGSGAKVKGGRKA
jgi:cobyrinic acid a,c-diamide synthase